MFLDHGLLSQMIPAPILHSLKVCKHIICITVDKYIYNLKKKRKREIPELHQFKKCYIRGQGEKFSA